jgi:hypothetical protein
MNTRVGNISLPQKKPNELGKKPYSDKLSRLIDEVQYFILILFLHFPTHFHIFN